MPRITDDNKYGQCDGVAETAGSGTRSVTVTTDVDEEQDWTGTRVGGCVRFERQAGTLRAAAARQAKQ